MLLLLWWWWWCCCCGDVGVDGLAHPTPPRCDIQDQLDTKTYPRSEYPVFILSVVMVVLCCCCYGGGGGGGGGGVVVMLE